MPPRWCICEGLHTIDCALGIDVLIHDREVQRPTSTGHLINRVFPASRSHRFRPERSTVREILTEPGRELWILHPHGEEMPTPPPPASSVQVLLLDGNWPQAKLMLRELGGMGRKVRLPMTGKSRYWLRAQQGEGHFSTAEALLFLLGALGLEEVRSRFDLLFELHVFASLCLRGNRRLAEEFLESSPLRTERPELVARLQSKHREDRPNEA